MAAPDLWTLTRTRPQIDPHDLAEAIQTEVEEETLDYRSRLLVRDSVDALRTYWGEAKTRQWLAESGKQSRIESICAESFDKVGYPSLRKRLMDKTAPDTVRQFLEFLGSRIHHKVRLFVAGSIALIVPGYLSRHTEDVVIVDEIPSEIRENHDLLSSLEKGYGLRLGHVQSHYFPPGWESRVHSVGRFGEIDVYLLDVFDIFLSKLFSARLKDMEDLRVLVPQLDKNLLIEKLTAIAQSFLGEPRLRQTAQTNCKILFGEELPT